MSEKTVSTVEFEENFRTFIDEIERTHEAVTITDHGRAVARLVPFDEKENNRSAAGAKVKLGGLKGSVLRYEDPFAPALASTDWNAIR